VSLQLHDDHKIISATGFGASSLWIVKPFGGGAADKPGRERRHPAGGLFQPAATGQAGRRLIIYDLRYSIYALAFSAGMDS
jgi:hypothetical protein